jgi:uroporphyrinogen decarboxylase
MNLTMNSYHRVISVLYGKKPDVTPVIPIVREWCSRQAGIEFTDELDNVETHVYSQSFCTNHFGYDVVWDVFGCHSESEAMGSVLKVCKGYAPVLERPAVEDYKRDLPKLKLIDPYLNKRLSSILEGVRRLKKRFAGEVTVIGSLQAPFRHASVLRGHENLMRDLYKERDNLKELCEIALNSLIVYAVALISAGPDIIWISDPVSSGDVLSKKQFEEWGFPYTKRLVNMIKRSGTRTIMHVCGNSIDRLETLAMTGVDCLSLDEAVDFEKARKILGADYSLLGNISTSLMAMGSPQDVEEATREVIDKAGKQGHLLVSCGCLINENCPAENVRAMVKAAREYPI